MQLGKPMTFALMSEFEEGRAPSVRTDDLGENGASLLDVQENILIHILELRLGQKAKTR